MMAVRRRLNCQHLLYFWSVVRAAVSAGTAHARGGMNGETANMGFINYRLRPWIPRRRVVMPLKVFAEHDAFRHGPGIIKLGKRCLLLPARSIVSGSRTEIPIGQPRDRSGDWVESTPLVTCPTGTSSCGQRVNSGANRWRLT